MVYYKIDDGILQEKGESTEVQVVDKHFHFGEQRLALFWWKQMNELLGSLCWWWWWVVVLGGGSGRWWVVLVVLVVTPILTMEAKS